MRIQIVVLRIQLDASIFSAEGQALSVNSLETFRSGFIAGRNMERTE
jgi:hypothetical protein